MKKKIVSLALAVVMTLSMVACGSAAAPADSEAPATDATAEAPAADATAAESSYAVAMITDSGDITD